MLTYKYRLGIDLGLGEYINQYNNVVRFSYNRFRDNPRYKLNEVEDIVKSTMNNIELLDSSMIKVAVNKSKSLKSEKIIFGGRYNFIQRLKRKLSRAEWLKKRNMPIMLRGSSCDNKGNRKAELHIIEDNTILIKLNKETHRVIQLPKLNKEQKLNLSKLQTLCEDNKAYFSLEVCNEYINIIFDETMLKKGDRENVISDRILSFDMNPNYIGLSIIDWKNETDKTIIHKEIISIKEINELTHNNYKTNKRKHETMHMSKHIIELAKHHNVETIVFEKLKMPPSNKNKGKSFNRLVNNYWLRLPLVNNIQKRCNIENIKYQEVVAQYSSFIGQLNNPSDYDSVAASIEISRRGFLFTNMYIKKTMTSGPIVFPLFDLGFLNLHWKDRFGNILNNINSWKSLFDCLKKSKSSYRLLFSVSNRVSFSLNSRKSLTFRYILL